MKKIRILKLQFMGFLVCCFGIQLSYGQDPIYDHFHFYPTSKDLTGYQTIYDVEDPNFEVLSGTWDLAKTGDYYASFYLTINGPGTGSGQARWVAEGLPSGNYLIEFWAATGDFPEDAHYEIVSATGITDIRADMNNVAFGWKPLGNFDINRSCVVNLFDDWSGAGTKLSADALRFTLNSTLPSPPASQVPPHIGICIDDVGSVNPTQSSQPIYRMLRLPFKMTFAVMPGLAYTNASAEEIHSWGSEVVLHQPMGYIGSPNPSGSTWIRDNMTLDQVRTLVSQHLDSLPHIVGMNNHTGSLVTQQADKMQVCMEELKARNLCFYDSRTYTLSVAYDVAKENGLLTAERDLFIDGSDKDQSKALIRSLALRALYAPHLSHLAIGHVRTSTADSLAEMVAELDAMGVEVWPVSRCITQIIETDAQPEGCQLETVGSWLQSPDDVDSKELYDNYCLVVNDPAATHSESAVFTPSLPLSGEYDIYATWKVHPLGASDIQVQVDYLGGTESQTIDQSQLTMDWFYLGRYSCNAGTESSVTFDDHSCTLPGQIFQVDAVKYVYTGELLPVPNWNLY